MQVHALLVFFHPKFSFYLKLLCCLKFPSLCFRKYRPSVMSQRVQSLLPGRCLAPALRCSFATRWEAANTGLKRLLSADFSYFYRIWNEAKGCVVLHSTRSLEIQLVTFFREVCPSVVWGLSHRLGGFPNSGSTRWHLKRIHTTCNIYILIYWSTILQVEEPDQFYCWANISVTTFTNAIYGKFNILLPI